MSTLREFIANRRSEIKSEMDKLKAEIRELDLAEQALEPKRHTTIIFGGGAGKSWKRPTIIGMVKDVLLKFPDGADAQAIINAVKEKFGVDVPRSSMSPQLSRLKADGVLEMENNIWRLADSKGQKAEGSDAQTSEPSIESQDAEKDIFG